MAATELLEQGRERFDRQAWGDAYALLSSVDDQVALDVEDLERLAMAAYLAGRDEDSVDAWARAHHQWTRRGDVARAVRCAFWPAFVLLNKRELARGGGWADRAQRLLAAGDDDCVERGHVRYLMGLRSVFEGNPAAAHAAFTEAAAIGERFRDPELTALAMIGQGRCLIYLGGDRCGRGPA